MRKSLLAATAVSTILLSLAPDVHSEPTAQPGGPVAQKDTSLSSRSASAQPPTTTTTLPTVEVNDPLLTPVPPPPRVIASFRDALTLISSRSIDLAIARQEIARAEGLSRQALAGALPSSNATGTVSYNILGGFNPNAWVASGSINVVQPILAPRAWYAIGTADASVKSSRLSYENRQRTVLTQIATSIVAVFTAERVAEINRVGLKSALQRQSLAERKSKLGDGTRLDVLRAQQDASVARATLISGDESLRKTREALGLALGTNGAYGVVPNISLNELQQALQTACAKGTPEQRADVAAARASREVASRQVTDAKLAFAPSAQIQSTVSVTSLTAINNPTNVFWSIQGVLTVPIWDGGARYGALRIAHASEEQARAQLDITQRTASLEAVQAFRAVTIADEARKVAEQNRDLAREAARLAERAFEAGAGTSFDLVDAGRREREAELDLAVKEFQLIQAKIGAMLATSTCSY